LSINARFPITLKKLQTESTTSKNTPVGETPPPYTPGPSGVKNFKYFITPPKASSSSDSRSPEGRRWRRDASDDDDTSDDEGSLPRDWFEMMKAQAEYNAKLEKEELEEIKKFLSTMDDYIECPKCGYCAQGLIYYSIYM